MAVLLFDKNNLGSRHTALIQLLMKSEGGFGGSWCHHLVQTREAKEAGVKTLVQGGVGFGPFKIRGFMQEVFIDVVTYN